MNKNEFIDLLKEYDFVNNSVKSFSEMYNICSKTVIKYLKIENIKYNNQKGLITIRNRDVNGRYCLNTKKFKQDDDIKKNQNQNQKHTACRSIKDMKNKGFICELKNN